ncbi:site-specific recombinase xerd [Halalkalicoccus jeotgali B3]|uniref:Site-specific recombinase xerd n=2 Tax=Halalkalicoccus jeotgali TaxID=413810 RepID=L9VCW2_HALJB|nr:site-specific recombinase xerd [Halalkalicoccus jeotgali B3]
MLSIEDMIDTMIDEKYSASSIRVRLSALSEFYKEVNKINNDLIEVPTTKNPVENITLSEWNDVYKEEKKKEPTTKEDVSYLPPTGIEELANNVPKPRMRNELLIRLCYQTGLRRKELVKLKLSDGTWHSYGRPRKITIRSENAKNGKRRVVGYQPSLDLLLDQWVSTIRPSLAMATQSEYLFPSNRSKHLSGQQFNSIVKKSAKNAGIQSVKAVNKSGEARSSITAHTLRHSFAMAAVEKGWNLYVLKNALGHSSVEITEMYLHEDEKEVLTNYRRRGPKSE